MKQGNETVEANGQEEAKPRAGEQSKTGFIKSRFVYMIRFAVLEEKASGHSRQALLIWSVRLRLKKELVPKEEILQL